jgi:7,8-dihydropterin-6-yl-methyl-4-(beta-D-ribofuranosyl)aminobenzene 5'-phosphate synthase
MHIPYLTLFSRIHQESHKFLCVDTVWCYTIDHSQIQNLNPQTLICYPHWNCDLVNVIKYDQNKQEKNSIDNSTKSNNGLFLFDTGVSENGVIHNSDVFGIDLDQIEGIILSHGHFDHFTGLTDIIRKISLRRTAAVNLFVHPNAFLKRWIVFPDGKRVKLPLLDEMHLKNSGLKVHRNTGVVLLPNKNSPLLLLTGEIPRDTSFEKGFPFQYIENDNEKNLTPDPLVKDDQALVANITNKGLIILTACGHSGIINTINYAKKITGINQIHAIVGGFHLPADAIVGGFHLPADGEFTNKE